MITGFSLSILDDYTFISKSSGSKHSYFYNEFYSSNRCYVIKALANFIFRAFSISLLPANAQQIFVSAGFRACPKGSVYLENGFCKAETGKQYVPAGLFNSCPSGFEFALSRYCASK